ncbi:hypothetical protein H072_6016 [Dactylellina haptotyla CBS 200.50]|uniref:Uncharacterized protein n=1 Tax=Dactylellina haptotyla (strain CBS 200.50) TaxID=1284197 RepID=S8BLE1_DACHA|nr:hypothetical protein H072_6016 [Dactylellina haptotyla CBS 200.50]
MEDDPSIVVPPERDPTSPRYVFAPEHPRLAEVYISSITTPGIWPQLPAFIGYFASVGGLQGRERFLPSAMRTRAAAVPRQLTPVEAAVISRYMENVRNAGEWFGLIGIIGFTMQGYRSGKWPFAGFWKTISTPTAPGQPPPSGLVYPIGVGQPPEASPEAKPSTETKPSTEPNKATWSHSDRSESAENRKIIPKGGPPRSGPLSFIPAVTRWLLTTEPPPSFMLKIEDKARQKVLSTPESEHGSFRYQKRLEWYNQMSSANKDVVRFWSHQREDMIKELREDLKRIEEPGNIRSEGQDRPQKTLQELKTLLGDLETYEAQRAEAVEAAAAASAEKSAAAEASSAAAKAASEAKPEAKPEPRPQPHFQQEQARPGTHPKLNEIPEFKNAKVYTINLGPLQALKETLRLALWGITGKYLVTTAGMMYLLSQSRKKELADERLQEYQYDRMEYAKSKVQNEGRRAPSNMPPPAPRPREPREPESPTAREDTRFQDNDQQSLGGLQPEIIDWGDIGREEAPALAPIQRAPQYQRNESAWDRARRERDGPQGPAMEEDRWAPQAQQDRAATTTDMNTLSTWERIRQQSSEGSSAEKRVPGESRDTSTPTGESAWAKYGRGQDDSNKSKEQQQKEFDAQLEKERRGDGWK